MIRCTAANRDAYQVIANVGGPRIIDGLIAYTLRSTRSMSNVRGAILNYVLENYDFGTAHMKQPGL